MITLKKSDIGGEIISILTKGMYSDPKDALREYVQNSVDAKARKIEIKIRQNNIVIQDDGLGMDFLTMRNAIRLGVSDKNPKNHVGFMGIGIYSSFHICEKLVIHSKVKDQSPNKITFNFKKMREELEGQRDAKFNKAINEDELIALQKLLENNIDLDNLNVEDFSRIGTRVELVGLEPDFFKSLSKFDEVAGYLEKVLPLPFDSNFKYGKIIEKRIFEECKKNNLEFDIVNLKLQVNDEIKNLFKPYKDEDFEPEPIEPKFFELKSGNDFFGIAWGCMNKNKSAIKNDKVRGFLIKKQGFTIGTRDDLLLDYFKRPVFFNRSMGEVIVLHPKLLPNASRSAFEPSPLRVSFYECLKEFAEAYNSYANNYQEDTKANEDLNKAIDYYKQTNAQLNFFKDDSEALLERLFKLKEFNKDLERRNNAGRFDNINRKKDYEITIRSMDELGEQIRTYINLKKSKKPTKSKPESVIVTENLNLPLKTSPIKEESYTDLIEMIKSVGIEINSDIEGILRLIDEQFIQPSKSKIDYTSTLIKLKQDIEELLED